MATFLERGWSPETEEIVEVVASHYLEAWRLDPEAPGADEIKGKAREMLVRSAERAAALAAAEEAQSAFERAAELSESESDRAALTERSGEMAELRGRLEDAATRYGEASRLFQEAGSARAAARVQARMAGVEYHRGHVEQGIERMKAAHVGLEGYEPDPELALVVAQRGRLLALQGRHGEAAPLLDEALELAEHLKLPDVYSNALSSKAVFLMNRDRLDEAGWILRRALDVALEHGLTSAAMRASNNLSAALEAQDRFVELEALGEHRLEMARRLGDRVWELETLTGSLTALVALGRWEDALERAQEARGAEELEALEYAAFGLLEMVGLHVRRGDVAEARLLVESRSWAERVEDWQLRAGYTLSAAELLRAEDRPTEALAAAEAVIGTRAELGLGLTDGRVKRALVQAVEAALDLDNLARAKELLETVRAARPGQVTPWLKAQFDRLSARVSAASGDDGGVESSFAAAEAGFRELSTPFDLAVALTEHAEWLAARGRAATAEPLTGEARAIYQRLKARPWLERLGPVAGEESVSA